MRRLLLPLIALLALSACGQKSEEDQVRAVMKKYADAFADRDAKAVCSLLTDEANAAYAIVGDRCDKVMVGLLARVPESDLKKVRSLQVGTVRITGNDAVAEFKDGGGSNRLRKASGRWRVQASAPKA